MGKIVIEIDEEINIKIKARNIDEVIEKIRKLKKTDNFSAVRIKTKGFKFNREEAEKR